MRRTSLLVFSGLLLTAMAGGEAFSGGCSVNYVRPASPAEHAGLQAGDFIVRVDSRPIQDFEDLKATVERAASETDLEIVRSSQTKILKITLPPPGENVPRLGVSCAETQSAASGIAVGSSTVTPRAIPCPFQVLPQGQRVRLELKDGRSFEGKYMKCDATVSLRSGILYRTFDTDRVDNILPK
jgi:membrane-associated protease RseP (regulator of RpoE activity)